MHVGSWRRRGFRGRFSCPGPVAGARNERRESPPAPLPLFAQALRAVKQTLDPHAILNPGVLID